LQLKTSLHWTQKQHRKPLDQLSLIYGPRSHFIRPS